MKISFLVFVLCLGMAMSAVITVGAAEVPPTEVPPTEATPTGETPTAEVPPTETTPTEEVQPGLPIAEEPQIDQPITEEGGFHFTSPQPYDPFITAITSANPEIEPIAWEGNISEPVITRTAVDQNGNIIYSVTYHIESGYSVKTKGEVAWKDSVAAQCETYRVFDRYTGTYLPAAEVPHMVKIGDKEYPVIVNEAIKVEEGIETRTTDNGVISIRQPFTVDVVLFIQAPAEYDGLVLGLQKGQPLSAEDYNQWTTWNDDVNTWDFIPLIDYASYEPLQYTSQGGNVAALQQRLINLGYLTGKADGDYGRGTETAVSEFQKAAGLGVTGIADDATQKALYAEGAPAKIVEEPTTMAEAGAQAEAGTQAGAETPLEAGTPAEPATTTEGENASEAATTAEPATPPEAASTTEVVTTTDPGVTAPVTYQALQYTSQGEPVIRLQQKLIELGFLEGNPDGDYGRKTEVAIAEFQRTVGIEPTGIADEATQKALFETTAPVAEQTAAATPAVDQAAPAEAPVEPAQEPVAATDPDQEETAQLPVEPAQASEETTQAPENVATASVPEEPTGTPTSESTPEETTPAPEETPAEPAPEETTPAPEEPTTLEEETTAEPAPNLLKNPEWESGAVGWLVTSGNQETEFEGHSCLTSTNSQNITVTEDMIGKALKFSGNIAIASSDTTQEAIGLMITAYKDDDTVIATDTVMEAGKDLTPHEVLIDITPDTAYVRVSVTVWKQGTKNIFNFSDLRLEETDTSFVRE